MIRKYCCKDLEGSDKGRFNTYEEANDFAREHSFRVVEESYEYANSKVVADHTEVKVYHRFRVAGTVVVEASTTDDIDPEEFNEDIQVSLHHAIVALDLNTGEALSIREHEITVTYERAT